MIFDGQIRCLNTRSALNKVGPHGGAYQCLTALYQFPPAPVFHT
jgi:hypothetical protein